MRTESSRLYRAAERAENLEKGGDKVRNIRDAPYGGGHSRKRVPEKRRKKI